MEDGSGGVERRITNAAEMAELKTSMKYMGQTVDGIAESLKIHTDKVDRVNENLTKKVEAGDKALHERVNKNATDISRIKGIGGALQFMWGAILAALGLSK